MLIIKRKKLPRKTKFTTYIKQKKKKFLYNRKCDTVNNKEETKKYISTKEYWLLLLFLLKDNIENIF